MTSTLLGRIESVVAAQGARPALSYDGRVQSYAQLWDRAGSIARYLLEEAAVPVGGCVSIVGSNESAYIESFLGVLRAGLVAVPINPMLDARSVEGQLRLVEAKAALVGSVDRELADAIPEFCPAWTFADIAGGAPPTAGRLPVPGHDRPACIIPTSGSTGQPKGVVHTQSTLLQCATDLAGELPFRPDDRGIAFLPLFASIPEQVLPTLCTGGSLEIIPRYDPERIAAACATATCFDAIPTLMGRLLDQVDIRHLENLRWVCFASEPMPAALLKHWQEALPDVETCQFYGMTELVPATVATHEMLLDDPSTVGRPFPNARVVTETGSEPGELLLRSPAQMVGYHRDELATAAAFTPDGFLKTGDLGWVDERGWVHLDGRLKELIITGGLNVAPAEIEAVACQHPAVAAAAAIGVPDSRWGETPIVVAVANSNNGLTAEGLLAHCRRGLKGFKRPSGAAVVTAMPSTGIGKVAKQLLREQILNGEISVVRAQ